MFHTERIKRKHGTRPQRVTGSTWSPPKTGAGSNWEPAYNIRLNDHYEGCSVSLFRTKVYEFQDYVAQSASGLCRNVIGRSS